MPLEDAEPKEMPPIVHEIIDITFILEQMFNSNVVINVEADDISRKLNSSTRHILFFDITSFFKNLSGFTAKVFLKK